jgi:WhiB family redox-sensing transcriptional regulator
LFFPSSGMESSRNMNVIKPFCEACRVRVDCLAYALSHTDERGIWAGTTENDRRKIRSKNFHATALVYSDGKYRQVKDPT